MVQAAPNSTKLKFQVVKKYQSNNSFNKTELQIKILPSEVQVDVRFIKPGEVMEGFTFDNIGDLKSGNVAIADGEYIGGYAHGKVLLSNIKLLNE